MKRTRRAALAAIVGSSSLLAVESFGYSDARADREVTVETASDRAAYLGLVERDGRRSIDVETNGRLFETAPARGRYPPVSFDVVNQSSEPIAVRLALADERVRFEPTEGAEIDGDRLRIDDGFGPGAAISTAIDLRPDAESPMAGDALTTTLEIKADGETSRIEAERTLTLTSDVLLVIDLRSVAALPDALVVVRKRRGDGGTASLVVERIDPLDGSSTVVYDRPVGERPSVRLSFPDPAAASGRDSSAAERNVADERDPPSTARPSFASAITAADGVSFDVEGSTARRESGPNDAESPVAESERSDPRGPVVTVDLAADGDGTGQYSRADRPIAVPLEDG